MTNSNDILFSAKARRGWAVFGALLLAFLIFLSGVSVGARADRFERGPHGPERGSGPGAFGLPFPPHGFMPGGHGVVGTITAVGTSSITIAELDGETEEAVLASTTRIMHDDGAATTLEVGDSIVVLGNPQNGRIEAVLIRILR